LRACLAARSVLAASFLNLGATAGFIEREDPERLLVVCAGTFEQAAYEDILAAGALCDLVWGIYGEGAVADSVQIARRLWLLDRMDVLGAISKSRNGRRLLEQPNLREDVSACARRDVFNLIARLGKDGAVLRSL
jgi:2-phosphosulfolactate phosphatase